MLMRKRVLSLFTSGIILSALITSLSAVWLIPLAPSAEAFIIGGEVNFREYTDTGAASCIDFSNRTGGWQIAVDPCGIGYQWAWITFLGSFIDGKRINMSTFAGGNVVTWIGIMDGEYDRTDASQFMNVSGGDKHGLVQQGNGQLQQFKWLASWANTTDSYLVNINNAETLVSLFFITRAVSTITSGSMEMYHLSVQYSGEDEAFWTEEFQPPYYGLYETPYTDLPFTWGIWDYVDPPEEEPCGGTGVTLLDGEGEGGDDIIAGERYYTFNATWENFFITQETYVAWQFSDGLHNITISFDYNTLGSSVESGSEYVNVVYRQTVSSTLFYNETTGDLFILVKLFPEETIDDEEDVNVQQWCADTGWKLTSPDEFDIWSKKWGRSVRTFGNANISEGIFEMCATYDGGIGLAEVNFTMRKMQSFHVEFAHRFFASATELPEDQAMQTQQNSLGVEDYGGRDDWAIRFKLYNWDDEYSVWNNLFTVEMEMIDGDEGADDEWTSIKNWWYRQWGAAPPNIQTSVLWDVWNAFIEEEPAARYRTWLDIWVTQQNNSQVLGGRTNAYYHGIRNDGWWMYPDWAPMLNNVSESMAYIYMKDYQNATAYPEEIDFMKLEVELEWDAQTGNQDYYSCIEDINIFELKFQGRGQDLEGVSTPIFVDAKVPDLPPSGFLAPLYAILASIGGLITDALGALGEIIWAGIESQWPWFTAFWESVAEAVSSLIEFLPLMLSYLVDILSWGAEYIGYLSIPIDFMVNIWNLISGAFTWLFEVNIGAAIALIMILFVAWPLGVAIEEGDTNTVMGFARGIWGIINTIIDLGFRFISWVVNVFVELIPF